MKRPGEKFRKRTLMIRTCKHSFPVGLRAEHLEVWTLKFNEAGQVGSLKREKLDLKII